MCGIVAVSSSTGQGSISHLIDAMYNLQHRGEDSCGAVFYLPDQGKLCRLKSVGTVEKLENKMPENLENSHACIGHVRYSTQGGLNEDFIQPLCNSRMNAAFCFNGNVIDHHSLSDTAYLFDRFLEFYSAVEACQPDTSMTVQEKMEMYAQDLIKGSDKAAFSVVAMVNDIIYIYRDSFGARPLYYAQLIDGSLMAASETCAFTPLETDFICEVQPGTLLIVKAGKILEHIKTKHRLLGSQTKFCAFEGLYFSREDSLFKTQSYYDIRKQLGMKLYSKWGHYSKKCDLVIGVPQSGLPAAIGFSNASGLPLELGIIKNNSYGRSFLQPDDRLRMKTVRRKHNIIWDCVKGRNIILVDDSLVRGHTMRHLISSLRFAKAKSVHVLIASPLISKPCHKGIDTGRNTWLPASELNLRELELYIGADSLHFLEVQDLLGIMGDSICLDCFQK